MSCGLHQDRPAVSVLKGFRLSELKSGSEDVKVHRPFRKNRAEFGAGE